MSWFEMEYRIPDYKLSDCLRVDPMWGRRVFRIDGSTINVDDIGEIERLARETAPEGFVLHRVDRLPNSSIARLFAERKERASG